MRRRLAEGGRECGRGEKAGGPVRSVTLFLVTDHGPRTVWEAISRPERLARWYAPVSGELRIGGRYRIEGNAEGTILVCDPAERLELTWEFAGEVSWVDVALTPWGGGGSRLALTHSAREIEHWRTYGPGAAGVGWDLAFFGLASHLARPGEDIDLEALAASPDGKRFLASCAEAWGRVAIAAGEDPETARAAAAATAAFYAG